MKNKGCNLTGEQECKCLYHHEQIVIHQPKEILRKLFTDHAVYTKMVINATLDNSPTKDSLTQRLLANQPEIGDYLGMFIGEKYGKAIGTLLTSHIKSAAAILAAIVNGRDDREEITNLFINADEVVDGLLSISGNRFDAQTIRDDFLQHNEYVVALINIHARGLWEEEIDIYDAYYGHMLMFSDAVGLGLGLFA